MFRRCLACPPTVPSCPVCSSDETCSVATQSCNACASTSCIKVNSIGPSPSATPSSSNSSPAAGAIAGGVVGGIAAIVIVTYLVWRFCIKKRREEFDDSDWPEEGTGTEKEGDQFTVSRDARASTHTMGSIASSAYTRASNVIQIAYIPGVTNRSIESSPDLLVPPVPPIPAASNPPSNVSTPHLAQDQFFTLGDLRDSTYSGYTDDARSSFARSSITPSLARNSIATTIYRNNAVINPVPAQTVTRGKATAVSVKSSRKNSPTGTPRIASPPIPTIDYQKHGQSPFNTNSSIVARLGTPKAVTVTRNPSTHATNTIAGTNYDATETPRIPVVQLERRVSIADDNRHNGDATTFDDASTDEDEESNSARRSLMGHDRPSQATTVAGNNMVPKESPFKTPSSSPELRGSPLNPSLSSSRSQDRLSPKDHRKHKHRRSGSLNQIIEEATRRASREPRHGGLGSVGGVSSWKKDGPFSDANAARTP